MSINLTWKEVGDVDRIKIYRSTSKIDLDNLPLPLANLDATEHTSYLDVTALDNVMYYYVVEGVKEPSEPGKEDGYTFISYNTKLSRVKRETGHGPTHLIKGDVENGYFGILRDVEFFTNTELCNALNSRPGMGGANKFVLPYATLANTPNLLSTSTNFRDDGEWRLQSNTWRKYIFNGKVIYIPDRPVSGRLATSFVSSSFSADDQYRWLFKNGVSWDDLFLAGAVYGNNEFVRSNAHNKNVRQSMRMTKDGRRYAVRLMRLTNVEDSSVTFNTDDILTKELDGTYRDSKGYLKGSEYFSLYSNRYKDDMMLSSEKRMGNLATSVRQGTVVYFKSTDWGKLRLVAGENMIFMEQASTSSLANRQSCFYLDPLNPANIVMDNTFNFSNGTASATSTGNYVRTEAQALSRLNSPSSQPGFWRPVLELID